MDTSGSGVPAPSPLPRDLQGLDDLFLNPLGECSSALSSSASFLLLAFEC